MVYHSLFCYIIKAMSNPPTPTKTPDLKPILAMLPLGIAVIPWGILAGAMALDAGLSPFQAQLMSLIVFAGAAQIAGIAIFGTNFMGVSSWLNLANSTTLISVRHLLYSASYQDDIKHLPLYKRLGFAFLLTDEMFVVAKAEEEKTGRFDYRFAMITGFVFYVIWNMATLAGILFASSLGDVTALGLDFAIAATFIAMVVPSIKALPVLMAAVGSGVSALAFAYAGVGQGLLLSALIGMAVGLFSIART